MSRATLHLPKSSHRALPYHLLKDSHLSLGPTSNGEFSSIWTLSSTTAAHCHRFGDRAATVCLGKAGIQYTHFQRLAASISLQQSGMASSKLTITFGGIFRGHFLGIHWGGIAGKLRTLSENAGGSLPRSIL